MKIVLIDSQTPFREAIKNLLLTQIDFELVGVGKDGYDAIKLTDQHKPDVIVLDKDLPLLDGLKIAASTRVRCPSSSVIMIAAEMDDETIVNAFCYGVTGFLLRSSVFDEINKAIRNVSVGNYYMSHEVELRAFNVFSRIVRKKSDEQLDIPVNNELQVSPLHITRTETQIAAFVGQGLSNKQIAENLKLKEGTVRNYISLILQKTKLQHRTQIALYALNNGFYCKFEAGGKKTCKPDKVTRVEQFHFMDMAKYI
ncbi:MAG: response regulator transcription factor [Spirochaetaceae bacterium]|jgi:DNA-binding NarL/FixJ family response regulator|nr:response regulator transcription factor [Spirochaetaceae bacterium]